MEKWGRDVQVELRGDQGVKVVALDGSRGSEGGVVEEVGKG